MRDAVDSVAQLHADVSRVTTRLHLLHVEQLQCRKGCSACCVDDLSIFAVEVAEIRLHHGALLASGTPHAEGACAFLDGAGACRIYEERPYVCRTQGLPLRWIEERDTGDVELRDICVLNDEHPATPLEALAEVDCWTLGPTEDRLARLQIASSSPSATVSEAQREKLRDLFVRASDGQVRKRSPSSIDHSPRGIVMGDKSPKAKDKNKKQHTSETDQKKAAAADKAKKAAPDVKKK